MSRRPVLLIVDDNELNRDALSRRLEARGYEALSVESGEQAIQVAENIPPDLVLLDDEMPGMSGLDTLSALRGRHAPAALPIIMVTARTQGADIVDAFRRGANDYVTKPIDFPVALARIETHLSLKRTNEALRKSEERYALATGGANDGIWDWDVAAGSVFWSARWKAMLGLSDEDIHGAVDEWLVRVHPDDAAALGTGLRAYLEGGDGPFEDQHRLLHRDGSFRWVSCRAAAVRDARGVATRLAGSFSDITERKVADPLTGLPNGLLFNDLLERAITRGRRRPDYVYALLVLGLDNFKSVNATLGLHTADELLIAVARRLQTCLRATDAITHDCRDWTLARLGGDEFTVLIDDIADARGAIRVADRMRAAVQDAFSIDGLQVFTTATIGIAVSTTGYERPPDMIRDAVAAQQRAAAAGPGRCELFDPAIRERAVSRLRIETDLREALDAGTFAFHYQPIVAIRSGRIAGFEALVRWRHPRRGMVSPAEFIPVAEETGMVRQIGSLALAQSCLQMARWQRQFGAAAPRFMCVNVSGRQLFEYDLAAEIEQVLSATGLHPSCLKLEITESAVVLDVPSAQAVLSRVQAMGVDWSLDDFGTGYSSLSYLHRLRVGTVKADRAFVSRLESDPRGAEMVRAIVAMAHNMGMDVVAEGVETATQLDELRALNCDYAQGFLFSPAVDALAAECLFASQVVAPLVVS